MITQKKVTARRPEVEAPVNWGAALLAGVFAGGVFLLLELLTAWLFGAGTPFGPAQVTLEGVLGRKAPAGGGNAGLVLAGLFLHFSLAVFLTLVLARIIHSWRLHLALAVSLVLGYLLYFLNFHLFALVLPMLGTARDLSMLANYMVFGVSGAWAYKRLQWHVAMARAESRAMA